MTDKDKQNGGRAERIRQFTTTMESPVVVTADVSARELQAIYKAAPRVMRNVVRSREHMPEG